jgi:hypothetical protein
MQDTKCDKEYENDCLHLHNNKCLPCKYYKKCKYIQDLNKHLEIKKGTQND